MADPEPGPEATMSDGVTSPSDITNEKHALAPEYPRVSYSLSPDTGLAEIVDDIDANLVKAIGSYMPIDPALLMAADAVLDASMQNPPLFAPELPMTPPQQTQTRIELDETWALVSAEDERKRLAVKERATKSYPDDDEGEFTSNHVMGPVTVFPAYLRLTIENWHAKRPDDKPPWTVRIPVTGIRAWGDFKIFSRDGDECQLSVHRLNVRPPGHIKYLRYNVMLLHTESGHDQFVGISSCRPPTGRVNAKLNPIYGHYLIAWDSERGDWEVEVAAVRISTAKGSTTEARLVFRPSLFDHADRNIKPCRGMNNQRGAKRQQTNNDFTSDPLQDAPKAPARKRRTTDGPQFDSGQGASTNHAKIRRVTVDENGSPGLDFQSRGVARRLSYKSNARNRNPDVRIKLSIADNVRQFPLEDCDVSSLFEKTRQFYGAMKIPTGTNWGLSCKIDGMEEARFIGEGCQDEWEMLCKDVRALAVNEDGPHLLEIQLAGL